MRNRTHATVFVDDYVQNRLPGVCVVTGEPTTDRLISETVVDRPSLGWLILLAFGPVGWIVALAVFAFGHRSYLGGELPLSEESYRGEKRRSAIAAVVSVAVAVPIALLTLLLSTAIGIAGLAVAAAVGIAVYIQVSPIGPSIRLDASRRYVTIRNVHPAFAAAVEERRREANLV